MKLPMTNTNTDETEENYLYCNMSISLGCTQFLTGLEVRMVRKIGPLCSARLKAQQARTVRNYFAKRQIVQYFANIVLPPEGQLFGLIHSHDLQGTPQKQRCR